MLKTRIITGLVALILLVAALWFDKPDRPFFSIFMAIWGLGAVFEIYDITGTTKVRFLSVVGLIWTVLFILSPHFRYPFDLSLLLASSVAVSLLGLLFVKKRESLFTSWAWTMGGILYIGWLLSYFVELRGLTDGRGWVFVALLTVFGCDTAAFFVGRALGKHKMAPSISPKKTWEGAIAGTLGAMAVSLIFVIVFKLPASYGQALLLGFLISVFGQAGDLVESLFKRSFEVKDSGKLMPGHGGILDRTDSVVFAGLIAYYYVVWVVR